MRIIAGMAKGINLTTPTSNKTRPTSDRVKESIFSVLNSHIEIDGASVLDLYAGTGALGLEAISRGATSVIFVEKTGDMSKVIKDNIDKVKKAVSQYEITQPDFEIKNSAVESIIHSLAKGGFDIVFVDPPYERELDTSVFELLKPGGVVVYETSKAKFKELNALFLKAENIEEIIYAKTMSDTGVVIATLLGSNKIGVE